MLFLGFIERDPASLTIKNLQITALLMKLMISTLNTDTSTCASLLFVSEGCTVNSLERYYGI